MVGNRRVGDIAAPLVIVRRTGSAVRIRLNRPEKRNALNHAVVDLLRKEIDSAGTDETVRVIVLEGEGSAFCAGADLAYLRELAANSSAENLEDSQALAAMFLAIAKAPVPVIARVHGHAIAGGCGLASVCDVSIAVSGAKLGYSEVGIGFIPAIVTAFLLQRASQTGTRELLLTGRIVDAAEACRRGIVTTVVADEKELDIEIDAIVRRLDRTDRGAVAMTKRMIEQMDNLGLPEAVALGSELNAEARMRPECRAGIERFLAKSKDSV